MAGICGTERLRREIFMGRNFQKAAEASPQVFRSVHVREETFGGRGKEEPLNGAENNVWVLRRGRTVLFPLARVKRPHNRQGMRYEPQKEYCLKSGDKLSLD